MDGIDADLSRTFPLRIAAGPPGTITLRLRASWVDSLRVNDGVSTIEYAGSQGDSFSLGVPKWRLNASAEYASDIVGAQLRMRYISPGNFNSTVNLVNNHIPAYSYVDFLARAKIASDGRDKIEIYANVSNLFDKQPPNGSLYSPFYDVIGRYFSLGAKIAF